MIAILSATEDDFYVMPLPFAVYSWHKLGILSIVFIPEGSNPKLELAKKYCFQHAMFRKFSCEEKRIPTFSQVSRLFGAATETFDNDEILITGDSDMAVFSNYFDQAKDGKIHIFGADLTPKDQWPMCYCAMPALSWKKVMNITKSYQDHLSDIINPIQSSNIRGESWCLDQWLLKKNLLESCQDIILHNRASPGTQFATHRADRDGWHFDPHTLIDAHLPRPLTDPDNFQKVVDLFAIKYPEDDLSWMQEFYNEYIKLL